MSSATALAGWSPPGRAAAGPAAVRRARSTRSSCSTPVPSTVEINSRPERLDPPKRLIDLALRAGCLFSIDTDAHAPGQLDWQLLGCARAAEVGVPPERIVNTWPLEQLLEWTRRA